MEKITKKNIRSAIEKGLDGVLDNLNVKDRSRKTKKVLTKFSKELARHLKAELRGLAKKAKSKARSVKKTIKQSKTHRGKSPKK